ncbi:MAG: 50S ribosomal protein L13 [Candidatus Peribacteraceae bacterium]|nr:50S ribosomal protein L13 [Candidatus Peribacteraceae bacterium]
MKTSFPKPSAQSAWYVVDAKDQVLGRLCSRIATVMRGKDKASFVPHLICGAHVIVLNADKIKLSGAKLEQKKYYRHTGYFGGLKETSVERMLDEKPENVVRLAVKGMLPKNLTREHLLKRLHIYTGTEHKHTAQNPLPLPL